MECEAIGIALREAFGVRRIPPLFLTVNNDRPDANFSSGVKARESRALQTLRATRCQPVYFTP